MPLQLALIPMIYYVAAGRTTWHLFFTLRLPAGRRKWGVFSCSSHDPQSRMQTIFDATRFKPPLHCGRVDIGIVAMISLQSLVVSIEVNILMYLCTISCASTLSSAKCHLQRVMVMVTLTSRA